ncbi:hypothetical protein B0H14DRAFT_3498749 [Mycena olivaceomarginata]|nr:hypothetical protein B0H14DRAFT_3498749 [Mycena olivaceomarginata]
MLGAQSLDRRAVRAQLDRLKECVEAVDGVGDASRARLERLPYIHPAPSLPRAITVRIRAVQRLRLDIRFPAHGVLHPSSSSTLPPSSPSAPSHLVTEHKPTGSGSGSWAIWSRRPREPAHAPGVIISPRAQPPPDVVVSARAGGPLPSPPPVPVERGSGKVGEVGVGVVNILGDGRVEEGGEDAEVPELEDTAADADADTDTPSSSTDYTDTRATGTPVTTATTVPGLTLSSVSASVSKAAGPAPAPAASTSTSPDAAEPQPAASLLRPPDPPAASTAAAAGTQNRKQKPGGLPTSFMVGFSTPAAGAGSGAAESVRKNHAALLFRGCKFRFLTPPATSEKTREERVTLRGLVNTGNMCFANAVLQVLVYCAPFSSLFARLHALLGEAEFDVAGTGAGGGVNTNPSGAQDDGGGGGGVLGPAPLVCATGVFMREFIVNASAKKPVSGGAGGKGKGKVSPAEPKAFIPTHVYDALKGKKRFDGMRAAIRKTRRSSLGSSSIRSRRSCWRSPPASRLLRASKRATATPSADGRGRVVVEEREEEAPPETEDGWLEVGRKNRTVVTRTIKSAESPITRIFGGRFRSTLRAPGQKDSVIVEDWRSLRLDIQMSHPSHPGIVVDASQQILIDALPPILILHVKRFCCDMAVGGVVKVGKRVAFGPELEVGNDVLVPTARKQPVRYKLFGVVYHHGVSASGGHYMLDVIRPTRSPAVLRAPAASARGWVRIDNELVSDLRPLDVFGAPEGDSRYATAEAWKFSSTQGSIVPM